MNPRTIIINSLTLKSTLRNIPYLSFNRGEFLVLTIFQIILVYLNFKLLNNKSFVKKKRTSCGNFIIMQNISKLFLKSFLLLYLLIRRKYKFYFYIF